MAESSYMPSESARKFSAAFLHRISAVTAAKVSEVTGISEATLSRITSGRGLMPDEIQPVLKAIGLKIVPLDHVCIDATKDQAKTVYAEMGMRCERDHAHLNRLDGPHVDWNS